MSDDKEEMSREDAKFMEIMEKSVSFKDGHYSLKLPFKNRDVVMSNNLCIAKQCRLGIKRKLWGEQQRTVSASLMKRWLTQCLRTSTRMIAWKAYLHSMKQSKWSKIWPFFVTKEASIWRSGSAIAVRSYRPLQKKTGLKILVSSIWNEINYQWKVP